MGNSCLERTLHCCLLRIDVYPLMVESGIGKKIYTLLLQFDIVAHTEILAEHCGKLFIIVDY